MHVTLHEKSGFIASLLALCGLFDGLYHMMDARV